MECKMSQAHKMLRLVLNLLLLVAVNAVSRPPSITVNPGRDIYYKPGETVEIPCEAIGSPAPTFLWKRNKIDYNPSGNDARVVQLPDKGTLVFNSPEEKDEGMFQCFAKNDFGISVSSVTNMRAAKLGMFQIKDPEIHRPVLGTSLTIDCIIPESVPDPEVIWIVNQPAFESINFDNRITMDREYRLRIANVQKEDERNGEPYACMAMNKNMRSNTQGHLHYIQVQGVENFQGVELLWADPNDLLGLKGDDFKMQCIFSGNPTPEIQWERTDGNRTITSRAKFLLFSQMLEIRNLQPEDAGRYQCWATSESSGSRKAQHQFRLRVASRPSFLEEPKDVEVSVGGDVEFTCAAEADPEPSIEWTINGLALNDPVLVAKGKKFARPLPTKLFFKNVTVEDNMVIQCNASNKYGYVFSDVILNVLAEAPDMIEGPQAMKVTAEGQNIKLTCRTTGKPDPIITWYKDSIPVSGGRFQILKDGSLYITGVVLADASHYSCVASNEYGSVQGEGTLVIRRKTTIEQKPGDLERNAGMDAKFTCAGTTDPEEVHNLRVYWEKDGDEILATDKRATTNYQDNSLTISGTNVRDSGTYTCVATNGLDSARASAVLIVRDKPDAPLDVFQQECKADVEILWMPGSFNNAPLQYYVLQYNTSFNPDQWAFAMKINGSLTKVKYILSPWVDYNFRLIAHNKIGDSSPSRHTPRVCSTQPKLPDYNPKNLRTLGFQRNKLYIEWTPIPEIHHNAAGFYYYLTWELGGSNSNAKKPFKKITNWTINYWEVETGLVYAKYKITIRAGNIIGQAKTEATVLEDGRSYEDTPTVVPTNFVVDEIGDTFAYFNWDFPRREINKEESKIKGKFMGFKIQFWQRGYKEDTIREFDVGPESAENITGNMFSSRVANMIPNTNMEARISVKNNYYIGQPSDTIQFKTKPGFPGPVDYFNVINVGDTHVNLEWRTPLENRGDLMGYDISYQLVNGLELGEMQEREPQINDPWTTNGILSGLEPKRKYRVYIYARTKKGRGEGYFIELFTSKPVTPEIPDFSIPHITATSINVSWWVDAYRSSGSVIFVEYRKLDGAEWLRTSDEVVHTWQKISDLEPGTKYEVRIKATNGHISIPSAIEEVMTDGNAKAYDLVENYIWFLFVILSELVIIGVIILFVLCWKNGFRFERPQMTDQPYNSSSVAYSDTAQIDKGPEPKGYNNDYYEDKDNYQYDDGSMNKPPSYSSEMHSKATAPDYEEYDRDDARNYDYEDQDYPDDGYNRGRNDGYYDRRNDGYDYGNRDYDGYDYDKREDGYGNNYERDDGYGRDDGYRNDRQDDGYGRGRRDDGYARDRNDGYRRRSGNHQDQGYDYDSEDTTRPAPRGGGAPSSSFV